MVFQKTGTSQIIIHHDDVAIFLSARHAYYYFSAFGFLVSSVDLFFEQSS